MNFQLISTSIVIIFCSLDLSHALKCYKCDSEASCKKAQRYECNQTYANETMRFLDTFYLNVNTNVSYYAYKCLKQDLKLSTGKVNYKGCIYSNVNGCGYSLRPFYQQGSTISGCYECNNRDGCNPANRNSFNLAVIVVSIMIASIFKFST